VTAKVSLLLLAVCAWSLHRGASDLRAQSASLTVIGSIQGPAELVEVRGRFAYVAASRTLTIVDIYDPAVPARRGAYTFPDKIWGFTIAGADVYAAADLAGVGIVDVSNPDEPALRGWFKTKGQAHGVAVFESHAIVADHMMGAYRLDVSDPSKPVASGSFFLEGYPRDVVASGSIVYAVDSPTGFYVFDLSRPGALEPLASLQVDAKRALGQLAASASPAGLVCVAGGGVLQVFDVSTPAAPVLKGTLQMSGRGQRVALLDATAYVADGPVGLQVVDVSAPSKPTIVGTYKTRGPARDVAASGSLVLVAAGDEVLILRRN
jgi:hypothetical protein